MAVSFYLYHKTTAPQEKRNGTEGAGLITQPPTLCH